MGRAPESQGARNSDGGYPVHTTLVFRRLPLSTLVSLTLLANRAPVRQTDDGWAPALGGLATALLPVLRKQRGLWISSRDPGDDAPEQQRFPEGAAADEAFDIRRLPLSEVEYADYYQGVANRVLWPLCHYITEHVVHDGDFFGGYRAVNRRFAEAALAHSRPDAPVWVHDYHLPLVPALLRAERPAIRVGHFWHIPWPSLDVLRMLPQAEEVVRGLLGADLLGFHTDVYAAHFRRAAVALAGAEEEGTLLHYGGRRVRAEAHPIGIDAGKFEAWGADEAVAREARSLRREMDAQRLVISVDRLDYTKGLLSRLRAIEQLFEQHPAYVGDVSFIQIATPSRTGIPAYQRLKREVDEAVGRINGRFGEGRWVPVHYRYRSYDQRDLAVRYRAADVGLVTPLRDGMNLVAQEYVATTQRGALILSELAGAARFLNGAVVVNPFDTDALVAALHRALAMPREERHRRLRPMKKQVRAMDVHAWAERFLERLRGSSPAAGPTQSDASAPEAAGSDQGTSDEDAGDGVRSTVPPLVIPRSAMGSPRA